MAELAPWHDIAITHEVLDFAYEMNTANLPPTYHFSVKDGKVFYKERPPEAPYRTQLMSMLRKVAQMVRLPDVEFILHSWDHAKVPRTDVVPVFSNVREASRADIATPNAHYWDYKGRK
jgi:hypothetical protein